MQASYSWEILRFLLCCHNFSFIVWQKGLEEKVYIAVISTCLGNTQSLKHWASKSVFRQSAVPLFWDTLSHKVKEDGLCFTRKNVWYDRVSSLCLGSRTRWIPHSTAASTVGGAWTQLHPPSALLTHLHMTMWGSPWTFAPALHTSVIYRLKQGTYVELPPLPFRTELIFTLKKEAYRERPLLPYYP